MLVLARNQDQSLLIGDRIKVTVTSVRGNTVRLGIVAPPEVLILRSEIAPHNPKGRDRKPGVTEDGRYVGSDYDNNWARTDEPLSTIDTSRYNGIPSERWAIQGRLYSGQEMFDILTNLGNQ